jgi:hypothetical protein
MLYLHSDVLREAEGFRSRRLDGGPYTFIWIDALRRHRGHVLVQHALLGVGGPHGVHRGGLLEEPGFPR